jgi:glycosyltransferase involved in cell wall biosynthesis
MVNQYAVTPAMPAGTRHFDLATELASRGYRVKIFASEVCRTNWKHTKLRPGELYRVEPFEGVDFVWVRSAEYETNGWQRFRNMLSFSRNFLRTAEALRRECNPAIVLGSSPHPFGAFAAERIARQARAHFVLELRDLWPQALVDMGALPEGHPGVRVMRLIERYLYARAERLIILAEGSRAYLTGRGVAAERILFVPNGVHMGRFQPTVSREEARARYGFSAFTLVYAGAHGPANSLETILQAGRLLEDLPVEFVLVGDGPLRDSLIRQAEEQKLKNVRFLSAIPRSEVADLLHAADGGVITLKNAQAFAYGVSPNKLFDYLAASRPAICSVPGDMAEMVMRAKAGVACAPEDPAALAQAARHLFGLPEQDRAALGANGREYLSRHFRREMLADVLAGGLEECLRVGAPLSGKAAQYPGT